jgi:hypothetical protein
MTVAGELATFLTRVGPADLPPQAIDHAAMLIASTLASAALGAGIDSSTIIRDLARERGGVAEASLWFDAGPKLPVAEAAQVNAVMSDAAASDDSDLRNIVHAGTTLAAAGLAMAERTGANGEDVLTAIVLGYEAAGRIGEAITPGFRARGFHGCLAAIFAGTVAAGRLLRLETSQMAQAIALSATSIGGLMAAANTSTAREYHAGLAAMLGVRAALAAQRGYRAEESILETKRGFLEAYGGTEGSSAGANVTRDLGQSWDIITDMAVKLVPGGHPYHALAEAAAKRGERREHLGSGNRKHYRVASRLHCIDRSTTPDRSDRYGAQPRLFPCGWGGRSRLLVGARDRRQDRRPRHSSADRQGPGRVSADRQYRALSARRDSDDSDRGWPGQHEHRLCTQGRWRGRSRVGRYRPEVPHLDASRPLTRTTNRGEPGCDPRLPPHRARF